MIRNEKSKVDCGKMAGKIIDSYAFKFLKV